MKFSTFKKRKHSILSDNNPTSKQELLSSRLASATTKDIYPGFSLDTDKWCYKYNTSGSGMTTDPFVRKALKEWDYPIYDSIRGQTKSIDFAVGLENLKDYGKPDINRKNILDDPKMTEAYAWSLDYTRKCFRPNDGTVPCCSLEDAADDLNGSSSAGFSYPGQKIGEVRQELFEIARYMVHMIRDDRACFVPPTKLAFRGHLSDVDNVKVRPVWNYPSELSIIESVFVTNLYEDAKDGHTPMLFGDNAIPSLYKKLSTPKESSSEISIDWSQFDVNVPNFLVDDCFDAISDYVDFDAWTQGDTIQEWKTTKWEKVLNFTKSYFKNTRVMLPDGNCIKKTHGVPSGSNFTQYVDSYANHIAICACLKYLGIPFSDLKVLGDDSCFVIPNEYLPLLSQIPRVAKFFFNFISNEKKFKIADTEKNEGRSFLGYQIQGLQFIRPSKEWFSRALYIEHNVTNVAVSASRMIGLYLIGGCNDLHFSKFFWTYFAAYPDVIGTYLPPSKDIARMFKYVFHSDSRVLTIPDVRKLNPLIVPVFLTQNLGSPIS